jgi:gamma-glutamyltranspeptidase/glutathione hydrolase
VSATTTLGQWLWFKNIIVMNYVGFFLNNEMDDFSAKPGEANVWFGR